MSAPLLIRAAELLEELAADIKASNTLDDGAWCDLDECDRNAHAQHDELLLVAQRLREKELSDIASARNLCEILNMADGSYRP